MTLEEPAGCRMPSEGRFPVGQGSSLKGKSDMKELTFKNSTVVPFDNGDNKIWFTAEHLADLLEYKDIKQVNKIYRERVSPDFK